MFGIGPMLPVIPAAEHTESKKLRKRKQKHGLDLASQELALIRRPSTIQTDVTSLESNDEYSIKGSERAEHHRRDLSLTVDWTQEDFKRMTKELYDGKISDLELSLFAFWIKAKHNNYLFAKGLVRELALDQGYLIDRIVNPRLRKLLQEVHDVRPRDPRNTSMLDNPFQSQTKLPVKNGNNRAVTSPLTARMDTLPLSLRLERERVVHEAARMTMISSNVDDYPPNTPDRPAPLSVKSRGSQASNATTMPGTILRSVSTPIRTIPKGEPEPLPRSRAGVVNRDFKTLSLSTTRDSARGTADVFRTTNDQNSNHSNLFAERLFDYEETSYEKKKQYMYNNADDHHHCGPFQLDASDVASESSYGTFNSFVRKNKQRASSGLAYDSGIVGDDSFDALESYVGTEDEDECSLLESVSTTSECDVETKYQYAVQASPTSEIVTAPVPTPSQRRATAKARRTSQAPAPAQPAINFHRPLPLRSYESEATMFPTAGAQADSGRNRAKSVTSIVASRRPATESMALPSLPGLGKVQISLACNNQGGFLRNGSHTKISEQVDQFQSSLLSRRSSSASTLAAFPIPTMENPVGELPMLVSRAASQCQTLQTTASQHLAASVSLGDTYRAITKVNMINTLQRTRSRGEQLGTVQWETLSSFERAWREMNEVLLVTIYGRKDVILSETDVKYVDCIVEELRSRSTEDVPVDWVRLIFEKDG